MPQRKGDDVPSRSAIHHAARLSRHILDSDISCSTEASDSGEIDPLVRQDAMTRNAKTHAKAWNIRPTYCRFASSFIGLKRFVAIGSGKIVGIAQSLLGKSL